VSTILATTGVLPRAITIDSAGTIYVANSGSNSVTIITQ
jgi:DNA-binding beta-propeller fold protein YncE